MKPAYMLALGVLVITLAVTLVTFTTAVAHHTSVSQAMARPGETLQVPGKIVKGSDFYDASRGELRFDVLEVTRDPLKGEIVGDKRMTIVYRQPKPENFDDANSVEAVGTYNDGVFRASSLLVKCPSKYSDKPAGK